MESIFFICILTSDLDPIHVSFFLDTTMIQVKGLISLFVKKCLQMIPNFNIITLLVFWQLMNEDVCDSLLFP